jgi:DNA-binding CsgD family transcriptional regulator
LDRSDKQIAVELGISRRTVRTHLDRLFRDHHLHSRAAAVAEWIRHRDMAALGNEEIPSPRAL